MITKEQAFENIRKACEERLREIYNAGIPDFAQERYEKEINMLEQSEKIFEYEAYRKVAEVARKMSIPMLTCNGSILSYLLGYMGVNPLPAHYYCPSCGKYECEHDYKILGIDLPEKVCSCGTTMISDGVGCTYENMWGENGVQSKHDMTIKTSDALIPFADRVLREIFGDERVIVIGVKNSKKDGTPSLYWSFGGYAVLPENVSLDDIEDEIYWLESGDRCISSFYAYKNNYIHLPIMLVKPLDVLYNCHLKSGILADEISMKEMSKVSNKMLVCLGETFIDNVAFDVLQPSSKIEMSRALSATHSTVDAIERNENQAYSIKEFMESDIFAKYPFIEREDLFIYLVERGVSSEDAIGASKYFRLGKSNNPGFREILNKYGLEEDFYEFTQKYRYLFPRHYNTSMLYTYLRIAVYAKIDRKLFLKVVNKKN